MLQRPVVLLLITVSAFATATAAVAQTIAVSPTFFVFSGAVGGPNPPPQALALTNSGTAPLSWQVQAQPPLASWLAVSPTRGGAPDSIVFTVNIAGLRAGTYNDTVFLASNDPVTPRKGVPVLLVVRSGGGPVVPSGRAVPTMYEVEFVFTGYTGLVEGAPNCQVNTQGFDRLVGTLVGFETNQAAEDVVYVGTLRRATAIDFCESKGRKAPGDDERVWCAVTLTGSAVSDVELTVYGEDGRGAFLKATPGAGPMLRGVRGNCDPQETQAILSGYPGSTDGGGASPSGQPIDDSKAVDPNNRPITFTVNGIGRLRTGTYPPDSPQGGWTLRVIRKIP